MEYVYAALLLHKAGKEVNVDNMKKVLSAAGIEPDEGRIKAIVSSLEGKNIDEIIANAVVAAPTAAAAPAAQAEPAQEQKQEEKEEKKEEEAAAGLGALFG